MTYSCSVYGLGLGFNVPMAGLSGLQSSGHLDVEISLGSLPSFLDEIARDEWRDCQVSSDPDAHADPRDRVRWRTSGDYYRITYIDGTDIVINATGSRVWATWPDAATVEDAAVYLLGPTLGFVLGLRGIACLHASAVAIDGRAVAVVGPSGSGKSTMAAAFARLGYPILSDDVLALVDEGSSFQVQPAYPRVRLWPLSVQAMFGSADALPRITPGWDKRFLDLNGPQYRFQSEPLPLAAIYFLDARSEHREVPTINAIGARAGLMALISNTYASHLLDKQRRGIEFEVLGRLAAHVPLRRVIPSTEFSRIPALCDLIAADCLRLDACAST